jgi:hypothetical protein
MKTMYSRMMFLMITGTHATHALASEVSSSVEGSCLLSISFIAFVVLIVVFQFIPGARLFSGLIKSLFTSNEKINAKSKELSSPL